MASNSTGRLARKRYIGYYLELVQRNDWQSTARELPQVRRAWEMV